MTVLIKDSFAINLKIMSILHLYSLQKSKHLNKTQAYSAYFFFVVMFPVLSFVYLLFGEEMDQMRINFSVIFVAETLGFIPKVLPFITKEVQIRKCVYYFEELCFTLSDKHVEIITNCVTICRRNSIVFVAFLGAVIISWVAKPVLMTDYMFPVDMWLPFNAKNSKFSYFIVYFYQAIGTAYVAYAGVGADLQIGAFAYQAVSQLQILQLNMENLSEYAEEEFFKINIQNANKEAILHIIYKKIKESIQHYDAVLDYINFFEDCFSFAVFGQFVSSSIVICFCCLQLSVISSLWSLGSLISIACICVVLGQIYFYCYYGTLIFEENNNLTKAMYACNWYEYDLRSRKALIIMMERSQKPTIITVGKILELSLDTFTMVLKRSYSLLAVIKNYQ